jgi:hypothetical protein
MLARSSNIRHPSGVTLRTPLLVPSFSSRGFRFNRKGVSEIRNVFVNAAEILTESMLVSAYDIRYGHLPKPVRFPCTPLLTLVDSGGYETGMDHDYSAVYSYDHKTQEWNSRSYQSVLDDWPGRIPAAFVSFDKESAGKTIPRQIAQAAELLSRYPQQLHTFLLKPTRKCRGLLQNTVNIAQPHLKEFAAFNIIGVTEKELGRSMLGRMETIAKLRRGLDAVGVAAPIQVFGALDPLSSTLYCLAGAEIFDGLTWLRYSYRDGQCVYSHNYGVLHIGIDQEDDFVRSKVFSDNYSFLRDMQLCLRNLVTNGDFAKLDTRIIPYADFLRRALDSLRTKLGGDI